MRTIVAESGQDIFDLAVQEYGKADAVFLILADNPTLSLTSFLEGGTVVNIRENPTGDEVDTAVARYFKTESIGVSNSDRKPPVASISATLFDVSDATFRIATGATDANGERMQEGRWSVKVYALDSDTDTPTNADLVACFTGEITGGIGTDITNLSNVADLVGYSGNNFFANTGASSKICGTASDYWFLDKSGLATDNSWLGIDDAKALVVELRVTDRFGAHSDRVRVTLKKCVQVYAENETPNQNTTAASGRSVFDQWANIGGWQWTEDIALFDDVTVSDPTCGNVDVYQLDFALDLEISESLKGATNSTGVTLIAFPEHTTGFADALTSRFGITFTYGSSASPHGLTVCTDFLTSYYYSQYMLDDDVLEWVNVRETGGSGDVARMKFNIIEASVV